MSKESDSLKCRLCGQPLPEDRINIPKPKLTSRQHTIVTMIANGYQTKQIAYKLGVKPETVSTHLAAIRKKLGARTNAQVVFILYR